MSAPIDVPTVDVDVPTVDESFVTAQRVARLEEQVEDLLNRVYGENVWRPVSNDPPEESE